MAQIGQNVLQILFTSLPTADIDIRLQRFGSGAGLSVDYEFVYNTNSKSILIKVYVGKLVTWEIFMNDVQRMLGVNNVISVPDQILFTVSYLNEECVVTNELRFHRRILLLWDRP